MSTAISFENVNVKRGKHHVLRDVSFEMKNGQIIGLLGPSGAGKSTVMRAIVDVQDKVSGDIKVLGEARSSRDLLTRVAYSTQLSSVFDDLSVEQNLQYAAKILGINRARVKEVIGEVGLTGFGKQRVSALSGGQRNRVSLAMALVGNPEVLILDEPTVGLDPVLRAELWGLFRKLANEGKTLIVSSHVMDEAERCDSIMFVRDGQIIAFDTLKNVLAKTKTKDAESAFLVLAKESK